MCRFCVEHGEGERWYLQAANYSADLLSDVKRREYMVEFIAGFEDMRAGALAWGERLEKLPTPLSRLGKNAISRHMQPHHFGQPVPLEECARIFDIATSITVIPCICRMHTPGQQAEEVCVLVTTQPIEATLADGFKDYANGPDLDDFNRVTKREAMDLLERCEHEGLMHSVWTFQTPFAAAICNCNLASGCMAMRMTAGYGVKLMWRGEWVMRLDEERCSNCRACVRVCPFGAIDSGDRVRIHAAECWGCGICRSACRRGALQLVERRSVPEVANVW